MFVPHSALGAIEMACSSSSSLVLTVISATFEDPSFRTWPKVAADALKSAQSLKNWYESETNRTLFLPSPSPRTEFSMSQFTFYMNQLMANQRYNSLGIKLYAHKG